MRIGNRRVLGGAPADAACGNRCAAVSSDVAAAGGGSGAHVADVVCRDCRCIAVNRDGLGGGGRAAVLVGAGHCIGGSACRRHGDAGGALAGAPSIGACAGGCQGGALTVVDGGVAGDADGHGVARCGEHLLLTIVCARAVGGIRPHIVRRVGREARDVAAERARADAVCGVRVGNRRVLGGAPADAACGDRCAAVSGDVAAARR